VCSLAANQSLALCLPPAKPADPAKYDIKSNAAYCGMFEQSVTDVSQIASHVSFVGSPSQSSDEVEVQDPQKLIDRVYSRNIS